MTAKKLWKAFPYGCQLRTRGFTDMRPKMAPPLGWLYGAETQFGESLEGNISSDRRAIEFFYGKNAKKYWIKRHDR